MANGLGLDLIRVHLGIRGKHCIIGRAMGAAWFIRPRAMPLPAQNPLLFLLLHLGKKEPHTDNGMDYKS
jgi:hypothetical protein